MSAAKVASMRSSSKAVRFLCALLFGSGLWSCTPQPPREFWRPWYENVEDDPGDPPADLGAAIDARSFDASAGDASTGDASMDGPPLPGSCSLAVSVTTISAGGRYAPRNIGAIWIGDASDRFVKTVAVWADKRARYLKRWNEVTAAASVPGSRVDAISSATKSSHGVRSGTWNCTDTAAMRVADGSYKVCFELTDYDGPGPTECVPFTKSPAPSAQMPPDFKSFTARKLEYTP